MAEQLVQALLLEFPLLYRVDLEIEKPWAPVGLPLDTVSVAISRGWHTAYIALGSNMGDKKGIWILRWRDFVIRGIVR